jgi:hypothetical protein
MSKKFIIKDDASVHGNIDALTFNGAALPVGGGGGGDVYKSGTPLDEQVGIWTGDGSIEGSQQLRFSASNILSVGPSSLPAIDISGDAILLNYASNRIIEIDTTETSEATGVSGSSIRAIHDASTRESLEIIAQVPVAKDDGPVPALIFNSAQSDNTPLVTRPHSAGYNLTTKLWEVAADGTWDYQGNDLGNINDISIGVNLYTPRITVDNTSHAVISAVSSGSGTAAYTGLTNDIGYRLLTEMWGSTVGSASLGVPLDNLAQIQARDCELHIKTHDEKIVRFGTNDVLAGSIDPTTQKWRFEADVSVGGNAYFNGNVSTPKLTISSASTFTAGSIYSTADRGLQVASKSGSTNDFQLLTPAGAVVMAIPTGTNTAAFSGDVSIGGDFFMAGTSGNRIKLGGGTAASPLEIKLTQTTGTDQTVVAYTTANGGGMRLRVEDNTLGNPVWEWNVFNGEKMQWSINNVEQMYMTAGQTTFYQQVDVSMFQSTTGSTSGAAEEQGIFGEVLAGMSPYISLKGRNSGNTTTHLTRIYLDAEEGILNLMTPNNTGAGMVPGISLNSSGDVSIGSDLIVGGAVTTGLALTVNNGASSFTAVNNRPLFVNRTGSTGSAFEVQHDGSSLMNIRTDTGASFSSSVGIGTTAELAYGLIIEDAGAALRIRNVNQNYRADFAVTSAGLSMNSYDDVGANYQPITYSASLHEFEQGDATFSDNVLISNLTSTDPLATNGSGQIIAGASDISLKRDIKPLEIGLDFVLKAQPVSYYWKPEEDRGDNEQWGFIANHEVENHDHYVPAYNKNKDGIYGYNPNQLIAPLYNAIKELKEENNDLKSKLNGLQDQIDIILSKI